MERRSSRLGSRNSGTSSWASDFASSISPQTRRIDTLRCHPNEGYGGFDVDVFRSFRKPGSSEVVRTEKFHTTYIPSDTVICTNPNATDS